MQMAIGESEPGTRRPDSPTDRTAGYGPVRPVVWEGTDGTNPSAPIPINANSSSWSSSCPPSSLSAASGEVAEHLVPAAYGCFCRFARNLVTISKASTSTAAATAATPRMLTASSRFAMRMRYPHAPDVPPS